MDREQFDRQFCQAIDNLVAEMADNSNISLNRFYAMACFMENLTFFSPVLHAMVEKKNGKNPNNVPDAPSEM